MHTRGKPTLPSMFIIGQHAIASHTARVRLHNIIEQVSILPAQTIIKIVVSIPLNEEDNNIIVIQISHPSS